MAEEEKEKRWPLVASLGITEAEAEHVRDIESLLSTEAERLWLAVRRALVNAGRLRDVRMMKLICHNHDATGTLTDWFDVAELIQTVGARIDKTKYSIVLENETEESVYLKIVKKQQENK